MSVFRFSHLHSILLLCCIFLSSGLSTANILGNETDRLALLAFKSQIILDPQEVTTSWNDSYHFCEWVGVTCSLRHQRVTVLNLMSKGLVGSISPHVGNLSFLRSIVLQNNSFQGEIPVELGRLFRLKDLLLRNNSLTGILPVNISKCSNLINLSLAYNNLVGRIPTELGSLSKLVVLLLHFNKLTGRIPPSLGNLTFLDTVSMSGNNFGETIPSNLDQLKRLVLLSLNSCKLSGRFPPSLYNISTLEIISITDNQLSGNLPTDIGLMLPNLNTFFIGMNNFSGVIPISLFNVSSLQRIDMGKNQFTGNVPLNVGNLNDLTLLALQVNTFGTGKSGDLDFFTSLTNCSHLQVLDIANNQFGGLLPPSVANFSNQLYKMFLGVNQISGNIPTEIGKFQNMIVLEMTNNFFTGSIPKSIGNLQNLGKLGLNNNQLSGQIPSSLGNMSHLYLLYMSSNLLEGSIAPSLDNQVLQFLDLSYNNFTGTIPRRELGLSSHLLNLSLAHNSLSGSIPLEVGNLKNLENLDVSDNILSGEVPNTIASCLSLEYLYLQGNFFNGSIPSSLSSLRGLEDLDLSRNDFSGEIPKELDKLPFLRRLNLSFNTIEGEVPTKGIFENASVISVTGNDKLCGGIAKLGLPNCPIQKSKRKGRFHLALKVTLSLLITSFLLLALFFVIYLRKSPKEKPLFDELSEDVWRVSYHDLYKATDGFSSENLIGVGSYGSVYKGILHQDENPIAVKVLNLMERGASKSFMAECEVLRVVRHRNLLKIVTVCSSIDSNGNDFKALVLELMPNGSLESWLHPNSDGHLPTSLNLHQRLNIAIDVASALDYLHNHCERPIIHCDLKSSNVLLDSDMTAHVGDFGLAKFLSQCSTSNKNASNSLAIRGTIGYIPPEYGMSVDVSTEGDVYSYGILLQEMFTGKRPTDNMFTDGRCLHELCKMALPQRVMDIIDMHLISEAPTSMNHIKECLNSIIRVGVACSVESVTERMEIKDGLKELLSIKEALFKFDLIV